MDNDQQEYLISAFNDRELKEVLDELYVDDAVDLIEEMPAGVVKRILRHTTPRCAKTSTSCCATPRTAPAAL